MLSAISVSGVLERQRGGGCKQRRRSGQRRRGGRLPLEEEGLASDRQGNSGRRRRFKSKRSASRRTSV